MFPYERVKAWEFADQLAHAVYDETETWPTTERYGLVSQARRAAMSVAINICEGSTKRGSREYARFLDIARGSQAELSYILRFARWRGWVTESAWATLEKLRAETSKCLWFLYRSVRRSAQAAWS